MVGNPSTSKQSGKRKSDTADDGESDVDYEQPLAKKPRASGASKKSKDPFAEAKELVQSIIAAADSFDVSGPEAEVRAQFVALAKYAQALESSVPSGAGGSGAKVAKPKTPEEIAALAEKLRRTACSQIKKQMTWKPSCKTGGAKWAYEGLCTEPAAFQRLMNLPSPPTWKQTKIPVDTLYDILNDDLETSIRYGKLRITSKEINVKWNPSSGEFRFAGNYGL